MKLALMLSLVTSFAFSLNITKEDVLKAQEKWGAGIVNISKVYDDGGNYVEVAKDFILRSYDYNQGQVLFKPTLASVNPFRPTIEGALSYFVAGNSRFPEDTGFAIKGWQNVRFDNHQIIVYGIKGIAMGHYYFMDKTGAETKVEYTLGFIKRGDDVFITIQDSSLPYNPAK